MDCQPFTYAQFSDTFKLEKNINYVYSLLANYPIDNLTTLLKYYNRPLDEVFISYIEIDILENISAPKVSIQIKLNQNEKPLLTATLDTKTNKIYLGNKNILNIQGRNTKISNKKAFGYLELILSVNGETYSTRISYY